MRRAAALAQPAQVRPISGALSRMTA